MSENSKAVNGAEPTKRLMKPSSEIDLQYMTTFPHLSSEYMSDSVRDKFRLYAKDSKGGYVLTRDYWAVLELFTQDWRLGNISNEEAYYVRYNLDLASDILTALPKEFFKPALISIQRAASVSESSQAKGGFLRRMFNSIFQHSSSKDEQPTKRNFLGFGRKNKE